MILLDTNAVIWLDQAHPRARALGRARSTLYLSPATLLELQFLHEAGRIQLPAAGTHAVRADDRWVLDDPPAAAWFEAASDRSFTRDPFDRLIAAHARFRGWRLATADATLLAGLDPRHTFPL